MTIDALYAELRPDIEILSFPLFELSEKLLRKCGNFLPHAAVLLENGKVELVGAAPDAKNDYTNSTEVLPLLHDGLRARAKMISLRAIGVAENVTVTRKDQPPTKAIKVLIEHKRGLTLALYLTFEHKLFRGYSFAPSTFSKIVQPEINAWLLTDS